MSKAQFNLFFTFEEAIQAAGEFQEERADLFIWDDPKNYAGDRMTIRTDEFYPTKNFDANLAEMYEVGQIDEEAKAALLWMMGKHDGFNCLELGQVIVGVRNYGTSEDKAVAIFAYLSKEDDCMRDFICELGYKLTSK